MEPFWVTTCAILIPGVLLASWIDYAQHKVPNWLNATLIAVGFGVQGFYHGPTGIWIGFCGMWVGFGVLIIPWMMHGMGAGDVKLMAAIGVWFGPWMTLVSFALGAVIGGIIAAVMIVAARKTRYAMANLSIIMVKCTSRDTLFSDFGSAKSFGNTSALLPYGVPLTIGSLIVLSSQVFGWWVI